MIQTENDHVLGFWREDPAARTVISANFSELQQVIPLHVLESFTDRGLTRSHGIISQFTPGKSLTVEPLDFLVLRSEVRAEAG